MKVFRKQVRRELLIQLRQIKLLLHFALFFIIMLFIFPLTLQPDSTVLRIIAPGVVWMSLLLAMLLTTERLFQQDYDWGVVQQWLVSGQSLLGLVYAKLLVHWLLISIPLLVITPCVALLFSLHAGELGVLLLSLLCGTPALFVVCALAAVVGMGSQQKGALMALIVLPLTLPLLIFGAGTMAVAMQGFSILGNLALLLAMSLLAVGFIPYAMVAALRISHAE